MKATDTGYADPLWKDLLNAEVDAFIRSRTQGMLERNAVVAAIQGFSQGLQNHGHDIDVGMLFTFIVSFTNSEWFTEEFINRRGDSV